MKPTSRLDSALYEQFARIGKAMGSPARLQLLDLLRQGPRTVEALASEGGLTVANASQHLKVLRTARLADAEKQGLFVTYRLADEAVGGFFEALRRLAESRLAEVEQIARSYRAGRQRLEPVSREELLRRVRKGDVIVLDVRPEAEYRSGHIRGAVSVPLERLRRGLARWPARREAIAYCRGPYCVLADEAVAILRARGRRARRLVDGFPEWRGAGLPVEAAPARGGAR